MRALLPTAIMLTMMSAAYAQPQTKPEVGRIEKVIADFDPDVGDAFVLHDGHKVVPREHVVFLYPGDKIVVLVPQLDVMYSVVGSDRLNHVRVDSSPATLPGRDGLRPGLCTLIDCDLVWNLRRAASWTPIIIRTRSHAGGAVPIASSRFLPASEQLLPRNARQITVIWSGGVGTARVDQQDSVTSEVGYQTLTRPDTDAFKITVAGEEGGELTWAARVVDRAPPSPSGFDATGTPSDLDRVERALYLLQPVGGREAWHLFAISELAALRQTSITADIAWRQVVTGQYRGQ